MIKDLERHFTRYRQGLPAKHEDLNLIPRTHLKRHACNTYAGEDRQRQQKHTLEAILGYLSESETGEVGGVRGERWGPLETRNGELQARDELVGERTLL